MRWRWQQLQANFSVALGTPSTLELVCTDRDVHSGGDTSGPVQGVVTEGRVDRIQTTSTTVSLSPPAAVARNLSRMDQRGLQRTPRRLTHQGASNICIDSAEEMKLLARKSGREPPLLARAHEVDLSKLTHDNSVLHTLFPYPRPSILPSLPQQRTQCQSIRARGDATRGGCGNEGFGGRSSTGRTLARE